MADDFLLQLRDLVRQFARERNWEQFHTPNHLAAALSIEASELLELFLWRDPLSDSSLDPKLRERVADELADVLIYLIRLADVLEIDLKEATLHKLATNAEKYPIERSWGRANKYTDLDR